MNTGSGMVNAVYRRYFSLMEICRECRKINPRPPPKKKLKVFPPNLNSILLGAHGAYAIQISSPQNDLYGKKPWYPLLPGTLFHDFLHEKAKKFAFHIIKFIQIHYFLL